MRRLECDDEAIGATGRGGDAVAEDGGKPAGVAIPPAADQHARSRSQGGGPGGRRVAPAAGPSDEAMVMEKVLLSGNICTGEFVRNSPHRRGMCLRADWCMHEGEWRRVKASGKGKFSWPSAVTFRGELRSGRMDGSGAFTESEGNAFPGSCVADREHGYGCKWYSNGDYYEGGWWRNQQEGRGRYVWRSGNQYVGEWRNGVISGHGALIWANGNRYDGHWENGVPKGSGVFTWPDGSCYVGSWSKGDPKSLDGTFYPAVSTVRKEIAGKRSLFSPFDEAFVLPSVSASRKRLSVDGGALGRRSSTAEKNFPKICVWESEGEAGDITCDIIDTIEAAMLYKNRVSIHRGGRTPIGTVHQRPSPPCLSTREGKKLGQTILKGHKNYDLMLNLQLGIRHSVGKPGSMRELRAGDFDPREKFWTRFPPEGSKITPPHHSIEFRWKDYCPMVLIRMLRNYYRHVCRYKNSLVTKFYGVHCVKPIGGPKKSTVDGRLSEKLTVGGRLRKKKGRRRGKGKKKKEGKKEYLASAVLARLPSPLVGRPRPRPLFLPREETERLPVRGDRSRRPRAEHTARSESDALLASGTQSDKIHDVILYFGIIDILQDYDVTKKLEHAYKSLKVDSNSISAVDPKLYSRRFQDFIRRIFMEDE
ncbi:hypothetical protein GW17_00045869 [Ensete ventricosum]|nr:hypothetical protein GW17_00045869 [Ensete ventricosum]